MSRLAVALNALDQIVLGKPVQVRLSLACLLAGGHLLLEDIPGVGKTTLAQALAQVLGLQWQRVQFTSDLLPADLLGVAIFDRHTQQFDLRRGPVFTQLLLADEINRASPRTQSALLEAMAERQVSLDGVSHALPAPFFVVATQNPQEQLGTFALPESQLDRFLMCLSLGYPGAAQERQLLRDPGHRQRLQQAPPVLDAAHVLALQAQVAQVNVAEPLLDYVQSLLAWTRNNPALSQGLSPRAGQGLMRAAASWALLHGRDWVLPEDVQAVLAAVAGHRLRPKQGGSAAQLVAQLLISVPVPD